MVDINKLILSLADMASFVIVVQEGSFSAASRKLGVSPSAVSRQITRLEKSLSVKLLERTTRKMTLCADAKPVYELAKTMLDSAREAASVSSLVSTDPAGLVRIAAPKAIAKHLLEPLLLSFAKCYPNIQLQIKVTDHIIDPIDNEVDLLVTLTAKPALGLICKELAQVKILLCASPEYLADKAEISEPQHLAEHSCIILAENAKDDLWELSDGDQAVKVKVVGRYQVNHSEMRLNAALNGLGVASLPDFIAREKIESGELLQILPQWHLKHNYQGCLRLEYPQSKFIPQRLKLLTSYLVDNFK